MDEGESITNFVKTSKSHINELFEFNEMPTNDMEVEHISMCCQVHVIFLLG
jgi:hypothetical protein